MLGFARKSTRAFLDTDLAAAARNLPHTCLTLTADSTGDIVVNTHLPAEEVVAVLRDVADQHETRLTADGPEQPATVDDLLDQAAAVVATEPARVLVPTFFTPGDLYRRGYAPETNPGSLWLFRCEAVASNPSTGTLRAFGWVRTQADGSVWRVAIKGAGDFAHWTLIPAATAGDIA